MIKKTKKKKGIVVVMITAALLFLISMVIIIMMTITYESMTEYNTVKLSATVNYVEIREGQKNNSAIIHTEEYNDKIMINTTKYVIDTDYFNSISKGDIITFRLEKGWAERIDDVSFVYIVTLKTEEKDIITLDSYNKQLKVESIRMMITAVAFCATFFLTTIFCGFQLIITKKTN